ncbi:hypothetical protein SAMN06298216_0643 [Spirosomataceae bacterium TFI 002]|nr:hypothetical protein SAMN06298216_0643 [Spirosomataceae bacterium TFI 002]
MKAQDYVSFKNLGKETVRDIVDDLWYDKSIGQMDKINISFELFSQNPEYGICAELKMAYNELKPEIRDVLWSNYNQYLKIGTDKQKEQIKYSLWVDFFEDPQTVEEAWKMVIKNNFDIEVIRLILPISGPVPYSYKEELYSKLISDKRNHEFILDSLVGSLYDVFGQLDIQKGRDLLPKLEVNTFSVKYIKFKDHLNRFNSQRELYDYLKMKKDDNK